MEIRIKNASVNDISVIQVLAEKTWWPTYSTIVSAEQLTYMLKTIYSTSNLEECIMTQTQEFIILYEDDEAQAFASFGVRNEDPTIYKLHKLYVLPNNHKKGFGKLLLEEIKKRLAERNINTLDLNVNRHNTARVFYERMGFKIIKEEDVAIGPYWMNDYVMRLIF